MTENRDAAADLAEIERRQHLGALATIAKEVTPYWINLAQELERLLQTANMRTDVLMKRVQKLEQEVNHYWTKAVNNVVEERDQAREESAGHKASLACALERNLKLAEDCGELEREVGRLRDIAKSLLFLIDEHVPMETFANGNSAYGVDEGIVRTGEALDGYRQALGESGD